MLSFCTLIFALTFFQSTTMLKGKNFGAVQTVNRNISMNNQHNHHRVTNNKKSIKCRDSDVEHCRYGALNNYCNHSNPQWRRWMRQNCPLSCGLCTPKKACMDKRKNCKTLSKYCTSLVFANYMAKLCPKTCKLCSSSSSSNRESIKCRDSDVTNCQYGALNNYCNHSNPHYRKLMRQNCPLTCGLCSPKKPCVDKRKNCKKFSTYCTSVGFANDMAELCPKTCKLCSSSSSSNRENKTVQQNCFPTNCGTVPIMRNRIQRRRNTKNNRNQSNLKIVDGSRVIKGEWPWHGMLVKQSSEGLNLCGVTIISRYWLVTAAHCIVSPGSSSRITREIMRTFTIYVGRYLSIFSFHERSTQTFRGKQFDRLIVHPSFQHFSNDIALIKLKRNAPIQFNRFVQPVCLTQTNDLRVGDTLTTYGWGFAKSRGPSNQALKKIELPFVDKNNCKRFIFGLQKEGSLCAGGRRNRSTCRGDSGGSLVKRRQTNDMIEGRFFLYGITSYGAKSCSIQRTSKPNVYTDVAHYYSWIMEQTNGGCSNNSSVQGTRFPPTQTETSLSNTRLERLAPN